MSITSKVDVIKINVVPRLLYPLQIQPVEATDKYI